MINNFVERIKNILIQIINKNISEYDFTKHKNLNFLYKENIKQAFESIYEFDSEIFDKALMISLKENNLNKKTFIETIHNNDNDYDKLVYDKWLTFNLKDIFLDNKTNIEYFKEYNNIVYSAIEINLINNYFKLLNEKIGNFYQHLDNDISSASATLDKIKSASHFLIDQFGFLPFKDVFEMDSELIDIIIDSFKNKNFLYQIANIIGRIGDKLVKKDEIDYYSNVNRISKNDFINEPTKIVGITIGNNLESILPYQLAYKYNKNLENIFKLNYIENKLLIFNQKNNNTNNIESNQKNHSSNNKNGGPFILCIDSSLSMKNFAEHYAKTFALIIFDEAKKRNKQSYIVNFSDKLEILKIENIETDFDNVLKFLKKSFHSGTNLELALEASLDLVENNNFQKSDIIVLSDFDVFPMSKHVYTKIDNSKFNNKTRFFAFVLSRLPRTAFVEKYYDYKFLFNGTEKSIIDIQKTISEIEQKIGD